MAKVVRERAPNLRRRSDEIPPIRRSPPETCSRLAALPIRGEDDRLHGITTDRDIVIKCPAEGGDPTTMTAEDLAQGSPAYVHATADTSR